MPYYKYKIADFYHCLKCKNKNVYPANVNYVSINYVTMYFVATALNEVMQYLKDYD